MGSAMPRTRNARPDADRRRSPTHAEPPPARRARGQSLVEFALVLMPLFLLILGIIQFGLIFNSYVTMTNAAREGARTGTIYVYDRDAARRRRTTRPATRRSGLRCSPR